MSNNKDLKKLAGMESKEVERTDAEVKNFEFIREGHGAFGGVVPEATETNQAGSKGPG